jgi:hypothetical protein
MGDERLNYASSQFASTPSRFRTYAVKPQCQLAGAESRPALWFATDNGKVHMHDFESRDKTLGHA